jgi:lysophospholipase L1-like esterase
MRCPAVASDTFSEKPVPTKLPIARLFGSIALLPLVAVQGGVTRRRVPRLASAKPPHHGALAGVGPVIRVVGMGESSVSGVGLASGEETVTAATARSLARCTSRRVSWRALGRSGASVKRGLEHLLPSVASEPAELLIVAFGVNDAMEYRSASGFADDLEEFIRAARDRIGEAAVVVAGVAPVDSFPALPSPLRNALGWRSQALQVAAERLAGRLPRLVVHRFAPRIEPELFAVDGFHPNAQGHAIWGEQIAALALPLLKQGEDRDANVADLTFLSASPRVVRRNVKSRSHTRII